MKSPLSNELKMESSITSQAGNEKKEHDQFLRILYVTYLTLALTSLTLFSAVLIYAKSYDVWLTPRHTFYMHLYWGIGHPMLSIMAFLIPFGVILLLFSSGLRSKPGIPITITLLVAYHLFLFQLSI